MASQNIYPCFFNKILHNIFISIQYLFLRASTFSPLLFVNSPINQLLNSIFTAQSSKHVDTSGKIYLPYLHEWSYPNSDLVGLVQVGRGGTHSSYVSLVCLVFVRISVITIVSLFKENLILRIYLV